MTLKYVILALVVLLVSGCRIERPATVTSKRIVVEKGSHVVSTFSWKPHVKILPGVGLSPFASKGATYYKVQLRADSGMKLEHTVSLAEYNRVQVGDRVLALGREDKDGNSLIQIK